MAARSVPSKTTRPAVGGSRKSMLRARVVFPLPDSPTSPYIDPAGTETTERLLAAMTKADLLVAVCRHIAAAAQGIGAGGLAVVPNGVDLSRFRPGPKPDALRRQLGLADDDVVVLHASNLKPLKRPLDIVQAATHSVRRNSRLRIRSVGGHGVGRHGRDIRCGAGRRFLSRHR